MLTTKPNQNRQLFLNVARNSPARMDQNMITQNGNRTANAERPCAASADTAPSTTPTGCDAGTDLDILRPEVREAINRQDRQERCDEYCPVCEDRATIRAELLRLADECATLKAQSIHPRAQLLIMLGHANERAEKAECDCNDLRKRLNDAISERNTIRRERAQEHSKHAREGAELAALKARLAKWEEWARGGALNRS